MPVHAVHGLKLWEFPNAGAAPGGPEVYQQQFARTVLTERLQAFGIYHFQRDGFLFDACEFRRLALFLGGPLDGTAKRRRLLDRDRLARQQRVNGLPGVTFFNQRLARAAIEPAFVTQFPMAIEDEGVRSSRGPIFAGGSLNFAIVEVGKIEMTVLGPNFHFR